MRYLAFDAGSGVRPARFVERSLLPIAAACLVANGIRETLASLLSTAVELRLFEPVVPGREGWRRVLEDARLFRIAGPLGDAALILRADDALALVAAAFGEAPPRGRAPSPIEGEVLARIVRSLAGTLGALTGPPERPPHEAPPESAAYRTFFELALEAPVRLRLGVAAHEPPAPAPLPGLLPDALDEIEIGLSARLADLSIPPVRLGDLRAGAWLPITRLAARLCAEGRPLATGTPGVQNGRYAMRLEDVHPATRGTD